MSLSPLPDHGATESLSVIWWVDVFNGLRLERQLRFFALFWWRAPERTPAAHFWVYPHVPVGVHLSSALLVIRDQLLVDLPAVLHVGQRVLLIPFPHHKQDHNDWKTAESGWHQDTFEILSLAAAALITGDNGIISLQYLQPALRLKAIWTLDKCVLNPFMSVNPLCHMSHLLKQLVIVGKFAKLHPEAQNSCWTELMCM